MKYNQSKQSQSSASRGNLFTRTWQHFPSYISENTASSSEKIIYLTSESNQVKAKLEIIKLLCQAAKMF